MVQVHSSGAQVGRKDRHVKQEYRKIIAGRGHRVLENPQMRLYLVQGYEKDLLSLIIDHT